MVQMGVCTLVHICVCVFVNLHDLKIGLVPREHNVSHFQRSSKTCLPPCISAGLGEYGF